MTRKLEEGLGVGAKSLEESLTMCGFRTTELSWPPRKLGKDPTHWSGQLPAADCAGEVCTTICLPNQEAIVHFSAFLSPHMGHL